MFERFTTPARQTVTAARDEANQLHHPFIGTEHLLLALLRPGSGLPATLLARSGVTADAVRARLTRLGYANPDTVTDTYDDDAAALRSIGIDLDEVRTRIDGSFGDGAYDSLSLEAAAGPGGRSRRRGFRSPFSDRVKKVLELSLREAVRLRSRTIGTEHLLLGLIREGEGLAAQLIVESGADLRTLRSEVEAALTRQAA